MIDVILKSSTEIYRKLRKNEVCNKNKIPFTFRNDRLVFILSKIPFLMLESGF